MRQMKDSLIPWIGKVPEDWNLLRNKRVMKRIKDIHPHYLGETVLSLSMNGVIARDLDNPYGKMPESFDGYQYVNKDNLLMCLFDIDVTPRCVGVIECDGVTSPAYSQFELLNDNDANYYYYYYLYLDHRKELLHLAKNLRHSFTEAQLGELIVPVPPVVEQIKIADYLDSKCSQIDSIIEKQEAIIEKMKEYKLSVITEAVTKGLDPNVEMKDSGVEWIGRINRGYSVIRLKYLLKEPMKYGASESGIAFDSQLPRYIRITDITNDGELKEEGKLSLSLEQSKGYLLADKDILFARSGGTVGKTFLYNCSYGLAAFAGYLIKGSIDSKSIMPELVYYYTLSGSYVLWKNYIFSQATIQNIGADKYSNMYIPVPPVSEQRELVSYLDDECKRIDELVDVRTRVIDRLQEYKKSLIYEVVTGKKEV